MSSSTETASVALDTGRGRWFLAATVLGSGLAFLDSTVVNVALPTLGKHFDAPLSGLQWTINGYALTLAALILLGGGLGDRYGRRKIFLIGVVWFAAASMLCGVAQNLSMLIAARILQGVGGALLTPGSLALIQASFRPGDRARAIGAWSGLSGIAAAIGPLVGGWLIDTVNWRWIFYLNVILAPLVVAITIRYVPESRDSARTGRFDVAGAVTGALALGGVSYALIEARTVNRWLIALILTASGVAAAAFFMIERRTREPMLPMSIFESKMFRGVNLATLGIYGAMGGLFFLLPLYLQTTAGYGATAAGAALLPVTLLLLLLSPRMGALTKTVGARTLLTIGPLVAAAGTALMWRLSPRANYWTEVLPAALVFGLGIAILVAPLTATVLAAAPDRLAGIASGVNNAVARTGGLLAVAALPLVVGMSQEVYRDAGAMRAAFRASLWWIVGIFLVSALVAWRQVQPRPRLSSVDLG